jgi:hypothetical protein
LTNLFEKLKYYYDEKDSFKMFNFYSKRNFALLLFGLGAEERVRDIQNKK